MAENSSRTILTIEDDVDIRRLIVTVLSKEGYRVLEADNGLKGIQLASSESVDLILLDYNMPGMDGPAVAAELKGSEKTAQILILMLTARGSKEDKISGLEAGVDEYLTKPIAGKELLARIRAMLRLKDKNELIVRLEKERHEAWLGLARDVQGRLLPRGLEFPPGTDCAVRYQPCEMIGGDLYLHFSPRWNHHYFVLGDVQSHGASAAFLMATARAYLRASLERTELSLSSFLNHVSQLVSKDKETLKPLPMVAFYFDFGQHLLRYSNAGHAPALIFRAHQGKCLVLEPTGSALGTNPAENYEESKLRLFRGDLLVSFTDGLLGSAGQEEYTKGIGRLQRFVSPLLGQPAENIVDAIFSEWKEIVETMPRDDLTLFALRIVRGPLENPEGALLVYQ